MSRGRRVPEKCSAERETPTADQEPAASAATVASASLVIKRSVGPTSRPETGRSRRSKITSEVWEIETDAELPVEAPASWTMHPDSERNQEMWEQVRNHHVWFTKHKEVLARLAAEAVVGSFLRRRALEIAHRQTTDEAETELRAESIPEKL